MELLLIANLAVSALVLVIVLVPLALRAHRGRRGLHSPEAPSVPAPAEALPAGCQWPEIADEFDGVWERFICRAHGESHLRRRI